MVLSKDLKLAICFGLIMGALISICNMCFATDSEIIDPTIFDNASFSDGEIVSSTAGFNLYYIELQPGYYYTLYNNNQSAGFTVAFADTIEYGSSVYDLSIVNAQDSYTFTKNEHNYVFFAVRGFEPFNAEIVRYALPGMTNFIDNIAYSLSLGNLSSVWALAVPIIAISVLLGLGFYLLKRLLNRIKRARGGV